MSERVVVVTGGTKGIGRAIATGFLDAGAKVVVGARSDPDTPPRGGAGDARFIPADVTNPDSAQALIRATVEIHGRVDILVNNAGGTSAHEAATVRAESVRKIVELNLVAPLFVAQAANAVMQEQPEGGQIVNIGSVAAQRPAPGTAVYAAAKAGLTNLTRALAIEWAPKVRVNQVTVGLVQTPGSARHYGGEVGIAAVNDTVPLGRMATPEDIAAACLMLTTPHGSYVTGAELVVDGGGQRPTWLEAMRSATTSS